MAESGSYDLGFRLDIKQILLEAQHRWLRPAEISEILRHYQKFHISPDSPNKPVSGSVFLFDRKVLRYFRKDGHNWRKKKDGKTVKEAHEKLKVGSVDMLHCYYAHGEDNENFQRRSYWLLEQDLMHIVFVHYLEVKGNKTNINYVRNSDTIVSNSENGTPFTSSFHGTSPTSTLSSGYEDTESEDIHQASSRLNTYPEFLKTGDSHSALSSSNNQLSGTGNQNILALNYDSLYRGQRDGDIGGGNILPGALTTDLGSWQGNCTTGEITYKQEPVQDNWQQSFGDNSMRLYNSSMNQNVILTSPHDHGSTLFQGKSLPSNQSNDDQLYACSKELKELTELTKLLSDGNAMNPNLENGIGNENYTFLRRPQISSLQTEDSLKKVDSFSRWMAKELGEADDLNMQLSGGISWSIMGNEYDSNMTAQLQADTDTLSPSISQDQFFSIIDFSPNWAYSNLETKVLITGTFLKSEEELSKCRWSIMFGEVEVPAEVLAEGILCCLAPLHKPGLVPFYMTCSNRLGCSEIREFEYRLGPDHITRAVDGSRDYVILMHLCQRFEMILCLGPIGSPVSSSRSDFEKQIVMNKIILLMEEENDEEPNLTTINNTSQLKFIGQLLLVKQLKQKFYSWLLQGVAEDGKGLMVLDERGQSVLHLAAALGFNWAFQPIIVSGVSIDFRDVNGWTALHWAAFYGREETVAILVALGAAPGALTDPSAEHPCKTPADLASSSGHKGISGYLAEGILTTHLAKLEVTDQHEDGTTEVAGVKGVQKVSERSAVPTTGQDVPDTLSLKDSLAAVCNATQAAARIHQIFRIKSFQRKQLIGQGSDELLTSDEHVASLVAAKTAAKTSRFGHSNGMANSAALQIQKKFRGWKKRKEFLLIRQKIVKIQAHVRGHQVRKKYKPIIWSVGILEKVILRWRRKGSGLRGFRSDGVVKGSNTQSSSSQEDDYDFLKEGRKQTEERMQKALSRVKSMAQYPEARAQYRRLLTTAEGLREAKDASDMTPSNSEDMIYPEDDLIDIESLFDDDALMSLTFQ